MDKLSIVFESVYIKKANSSSVDRIVLTDKLANSLIKRLSNIFNKTQTNNMNTNYSVKNQLKNLFQNIDVDRKIDIDLSIESELSTNGSITIKIPYNKSRNNNNNSSESKKKKLYLFIRDLRENMYIRVDGIKYFIYLS
jgi:hypothetical protein